MNVCMECFVRRDLSDADTEGQYVTLDYYIPVKMLLDNSNRCMSTDFKCREERHVLSVSIAP